MNKENIYIHFKDPKTGEYLNPQVIDELFLKNIPMDQLDNMIKELDLDNPYVNALFQEKIATLKSLTDKDIFTMDPQELIDLYYRKYSYGIYSYFKNAQTGQYLNHRVVDVLFLNNASVEVKCDMIRAFGFNYLNDVSQIFDTTFKSRIYMRIYYFMKKLTKLTDKNIFEMDSDELIELYYNQEYLEKGIKKMSVKPIKSNYSWGIYSLFRNPKTLQYFDKEIVNALFLEPGSKNLEEHLVQAFGPDYLTDISNVKDIKEKNRIYMRVYRFRRELETGLDDVYQKNPQDVITYFYANNFLKTFSAISLLKRNYLLPIYQEKVFNIPVIKELFAYGDIKLFSIVCLSMGINVDRRLSYREIATLLNIQEEEIKDYLYQAQNIFYKASKSQINKIRSLKNEDV